MEKAEEKGVNPHKRSTDKDTSLEGNNNTSFSPFKDRDKDEVWKELWENSKPVSREEVLRRYQQYIAANRKQST